MMPMEFNSTAQDKATGKSQEIKITGSSGLSEDEINRMVLMLKLIN